MHSTQAISLRPKEEALRYVQVRDIPVTKTLLASLRLIPQKLGSSSRSMLPDGCHTLPAAELAAGSFMLFALLQSRLGTMCVAGS